MSKVTIKDVAKKAGVSVNSVSRVLNNRGYISDALREKVFEAIESLDYTPNEMARSFYKRETLAIALIVPTVKNPFFAELAFYIEQELAKCGYHLFVCNSLDDSKNEQEYLEMLKEKRVDGVIVASHNMDIDYYETLRGPLVSIERQLGDGIPMVSSDNYGGGKLATETLLATGAKRILCVMGDKTLDTPANQRAVAYTDVMTEHQYPIAIAEVPFHWPESQKIEKVRHILTGDVQFDGIFAGDDVMATYVINEARKMGLAVPEDLQVIGFDGTHMIQQMNPELTTIAQPIADMAKHSVSILIAQMKKEAFPTPTPLPVRLREGHSTKK